MQEKQLIVYLSKFYNNWKIFKTYVEIFINIKLLLGIKNE